MQDAVRWCLLVCLSLLVGCSNGGSSSGFTEGDYTAIRALSRAYGGYLIDHNGQAPSDELAFKQYLETKSENWEKKGTTVDEMLTSPRSGKAMAIVTGKQPPRGPNGMNYFAYEQAPVERKRLVVAGRGMYQIIDESEFQKIFSEK